MSTLNAAVVAVRLRRFWLGPAMKSPVVRASDLGDAWRDVTVTRAGSTLVLYTPYDFGAPAATSAPTWPGGCDG